MPQALDELKAMGLKIAVFSNKPDEFAGKVCTALFGNRFDLVAGNRPGIPVKPDPAGLFLALESVVGTGDEVIIPSPFFTSYDAEVMLCGGRPVTVALRPEHGMRVNAADIEAAITPRTRAVIINSPGNPTGAVTSAAELARIAEVCKQHNIWAISDEVYHPFVFGETFGETLGGEAAVAPSIAAVPGMKDRTIVVESLSKTYAMTGWRIGYLLAPEAVIEQTGKIAELMHSSVNSLAQYAGVAALAGPQDHVAAMREEYRAKRQIVLDGLADARYCA